MPNLSLFDAIRPEMISQETMAINDALAARMTEAPLPPDLGQARAMFARGESAIPVSPRSPRARAVTIPGPGGDLVLRIVASDRPRGIYLHIHGGGWILGTADMADDQLERLSRTADVACVSVEYRLAPEHPYPAAVDDCETAALWLIDQAKTQFGTSRLLIGGESAGAHLSVLTLLRLRERGCHRAFLAANLMYGCYDLRLTPSAARSEQAVVLNRAMLAGMAAAFLGGMEAGDPRVSPLFADLSDLPPALLTVGTLDPLLDDSLFMHMRWLAAGSQSELALYAGGLHGFTLFGGQLAAEANAYADLFLKQAVDGARSSATGLICQAGGLIPD